jgi:hypothetical protein
MYCSSCGASVEQGLSFCKQCGAKQGGSKREGASGPKELFPDSLVWAIVSVFIAGLGVIIGLMSVLKKELYLNEWVVVLFGMMAFLLMSVIEGVLISQLLRRVGGHKEARETAPIKEVAPKELEARQALAIAEPAASVTEHTTRSFEPTYGERKAE